MPLHGERTCGRVVAAGRRSLVGKVFAEVVATGLVAQHDAVGAEGGQRPEAAAHGGSTRAAPPPKARATRVHPLRSTVLDLEAQGLLHTRDDPSIPGVYYIEPLPEHEATVAQVLRPWISRGLVRRAPARERVTGRRAWYAG